MWSSNGVVVDCVFGGWCIVDVLCVGMCVLSFASLFAWYGVFYVFFFKRKTPYEVRIRDWSSDVCSSDLPVRPARVGSYRRCPGVANAVAGPCPHPVPTGSISFMMASERLRDEERATMKHVFLPYGLDGVERAPLEVAAHLAERHDGRAVAMF